MDTLERKPTGCEATTHPLGNATSDAIIGKIPRSDGDINEYDLAGNTYRGFGAPGLIGKQRNPRTGGYKVVFVNGIDTSTLNHRVGAGAIAAVSGGKVAGVYNGTQGRFSDVLECLGDKTTSKTSLENAACDGLKAPVLDAVNRFLANPTLPNYRQVLDAIGKLGATDRATSEAIDRFTKSPGRSSATVLRRALYRFLVRTNRSMALAAFVGIYGFLARRNLATAELFRWLAIEHPNEEVRLVGHSQGTLILAVAIMALNTIEGEHEVLRRIRAIALAPPVFSWPRGHPDHPPREYAHRNDYVTWFGRNVGQEAYRPFQRAVHRKVIGCSNEIVETAEIVEWVDNPIRNVCYRSGLFGSWTCTPRQDRTRLQHALLAYLENYWDRLMHHFP